MNYRCDSTKDALPISKHAHWTLLGGGVIVVIISAVQLGICGAVYSAFSSPRLGAWWISVPCIIAGLLGFVNTRGGAVAVSVFATFGWVIGIIGSSVDGIAYNIYKITEVCLNKNGQFYGNPDNTTKVKTNKS